MAVDSKRVVAVIPARYQSVRFPGKPLVNIGGKPMIQWVYERAAKAATVDEVLVATDDEQIAAAVHAFGGRSVMTSASHPSGTDRIAEAISNIRAELVVNVQGDEPLLPSHIIDQVVQAVSASGAEMGTAAVPFGPNSQNEIQNPNNVKVVLDAQGFALYFSRATVPYLQQSGTPTDALHHWGLYVYRRDFLERFVKWPEGRLEKCEKLEQLRALENGAKIMVIQTTTPSPDVNVPEDVERVERILRERGDI